MPLCESSDLPRAADRGGLSCVILNWNGWQDTLSCVEAVRRQTIAREILIVDNGSTDESTSKLIDLPGTTLLTSDDNLGFSGGVNIGIRHALARGAGAVWLLNNDTDPRPEVLESMLELLESDPRTGLVGCRIVYPDSGSVQAVGGGRVSLLTGYTKNFVDTWVPDPNAYLTFASVLIRREVFEEIGLLDEDFFMYYEDVDYCLRATQANWKIAVSHVEVDHAEGGSSTTSAWKAQVVTASGLRLLSRHGSPAWLARTAFLAMRCGKRIARRDWAGLRGVLRGAQDFRRNRPVVGPYASRQP